MVRYTQLPTEDPSASAPAVLREEDVGMENMPSEPPLYMMDFEDLPQPSKMQKLRHRIKRVVDPVVEVYAHMMQLSEYYMGKLGNPLFVRRFLYVIFISGLFYFISSTGYLPDDEMTGSFSDHTGILQYIYKTVDMKKMEENLEYFSSMSHVAGSVGDLALAKYVEKSMINSGMKDIALASFPAFINYAGTVSVSWDDGQLELSSENFNSMSRPGKLTGPVKYVEFGKDSDYKDGEYTGCIAVIKYSSSIPVGYQVDTAQRHGVGGILFVPEDESSDHVEKQCVALPQYYPGDPLTPGWSTLLKNRLPMDRVGNLPHIPTVPITWPQARQLLELNKEVTLESNPADKEDHEIWDVLGKIVGREQTDKAVVIGASRDSLCSDGTVQSGTAMLLSLVEMFQAVHYKYGWKPLRNILFVSMDATEYNFIGSNEFMEQQKYGLENEAYVYIDIGDIVSNQQFDRLQVAAHPLLREILSEGFSGEISLPQSFRNSIPYMSIGIPVIHIGGAKEDCSKTFEWFKENGDIEGLRQTMGYLFEVILELVDFPLIPFNVLDYIDQLDHYMQDLESYANAKGVTGLNFSPIVEQLLKWKQLGSEFSMWERAWSNILQDDGGLEPSLFSVHRWTWNRRLSNIERRNAPNEGIRGHQYYQNRVFGPQFTKPEKQRDGVDFQWWTFPAARNAIDQGDHSLAQEEINDIGSILRGAAIAFSEES